MPNDDSKSEKPSERLVDKYLRDFPKDKETHSFNISGREIMLLANFYSSARTKYYTEHYELRKCWSRFLMELFASMFISQVAIIASTGYGLLKFNDYNWIREGVLVQNFAEAIALAFVVVKTLFSRFDE